MWHVYKGQWFMDVCVVLTCVNTHDVYVMCIWYVWDVYMMCVICVWYGSDTYVICICRYIKGCLERRVCSFPSTFWEEFASRTSQEEFIFSPSKLPKNVLIALFSAYVRPCVVKPLGTCRPVPIIMYQLHLRLLIRLSQSIFFGPNSPSCMKLIG